MSVPCLMWAGVACCSLLIIALSLINTVTRLRLKQFLEDKMPDPERDPVNSHAWISPAWFVERTRRRINIVIALAFGWMTITMQVAAIEGLSELPLSKQFIPPLVSIAVGCGLLSLLGNAVSQRVGWLCWKRE